MRIQTLLLAASAASASLISPLALRQTDNNTEEAYLSEVCFPPTTSPVVPPCQSILNIESACLPNGTSSLDLLAHAECMCGGSYFPDWLGCLNCDFVHGARSQQIVDAFNEILTSASQELCTGTPTASFAAIFSSLSYGITPSGTQTGTTDLYPSETAISLYYTLSGSQGPGAITGSATEATKTPSTSSTEGSSAGGSSTGKSTTGSVTGASTTGSSSSSSSSSTGGAAPTGVWMAGLGAVAGGMVVAAL